MSGEARVPDRQAEVRRMLDAMTESLRGEFVGPAVVTPELEESVRITAADLMGVPLDDVHVETSGHRLNVRVRIPCPNLVKLTITEDQVTPEQWARLGEMAEAQQ